MRVYSGKDTPSGFSFYRNMGRKKGNVLFNDSLNTFYLQLCGVGHMVKIHSDSERGNPLQPEPALGGAGPNYEQFRSAQVPSQLAPMSVELDAGAQLGAIGPIGLRPALTATNEIFLVPASAPIWRNKRP